MADRDMATGGHQEPEHSIRDKAKEKLSSAAHRGEDLMDEGMDKAREMGDRASEMARSRADEQRERVVGGMRTVADAIRRSGRDLPEDRQQYGRILNGVADRVESASRYLEQHDVDALTRNVRRMARDHAPVFLSGAFTLGMIGARVLKSSNEQGRQGRALAEPGYGTSYSGRIPGEVGGYRSESGYEAGGAGYGRDEWYGGPSPRSAEPGYGTEPHLDRGSAGPDYNELEQGIDRGADDVGADWTEGPEERGNV